MQGFFYNTCENKSDVFSCLFCREIYYKMQEIKIYGEVIPFQDKLEGYTNLNVVDEQLKKAKGDDLLVRIHTLGGDVDEGFAIYAALRRYAKDNNAQITTRADGRVSSIGTVIFLAGDQRIGSPYVQPFFHKAQSNIAGDNQRIKQGLVLNEEANKRIVLHYSEHTELTQEEAWELIEMETFLSPELSLELRFSTITEEIQRPKALLNKNKLTNMSEKPKDNKGLWKEMRNLANSFLGLQVKNKIVFTAENEELDFYELEENDIPSIGDKANFGGKPAGESNEGTYVMASGQTYKFDSEGLSEIIEKEESHEPEKEEELSMKLEAANKSITERDNEISLLKTKLGEAKHLIEKFNALSHEIQDEKEDLTPVGRNPKEEPSFLVRNLFRNIK